MLRLRLRQLVVLFADDRDLVAQEYNYQDSTYSPAERCWHGVLPLDRDSFWLYQLHLTCLSRTLRGISAMCLVRGIGRRSWGVWPQSLRGLPGLPCHARNEQPRVVVKGMPLILPGDQGN